ncbi:MAG: hypothetical protein ACE5F1_21200, partial [Planctomycetota bacterium]
SPGEAVLHLLGNIDPERDMQFSFGPAELLDHASRRSCYGSKVGIDATRKWKSEGFERPWPDLILMDRGTRDLVDGRWASYGLGAVLDSPSERSL